MDRKKTIFQLDTPYSAVPWPKVSLEDEDTILELLCNLLKPLGDYRKKYVETSKGKRAKKRKRKEEAAAQETGHADTKADTPPVPEIASHVDIGLASISRDLQKTISKAAKPPELSSEEHSGGSGDESYAVVFIARHGQSSSFHCHFPQMVAIAAKSQSSNQRTRLVGFSKPCSELLSTCLGLPRVSSIGLRRGAPQSKALVDFVREHVSPVEMSWVSEVKEAEYREAKINSIQTTVVSGQKKR